jgi:DNA-binding response OmpR family regulator
MVKVLLVDDDPAAHETLRLVLPDSFVLLSAYTARQGVEASAREGPDVVLLDINLPNMDGLQALCQMVVRLVGPTVVMLTAFINRTATFRIIPSVSDRRSRSVDLC